MLFFLADIPQKVDVIYRAIFFAYYCISAVQFLTEIRPFPLPIDVIATFV